MHLIWSVGGFAVALALTPLAGHADDVDIIDYRQNVMKTLAEQADAVCMILQQKGPPGDFARLVKALAITSNQLLVAFEPRAEGGDAKPKVWKGWDEFVAKANDQVDRFASLDKATEGGGLTVNEVRESFACESCHDTFRAEKGKAYCDYRAATSDTFIVGNASPPPAAGRGDDQDTIDYRRHIMKAMDAQTAALGQILALVVTDDNFVSHLDVIAINAKMALSAFEMQVEGGEALPKVWEDWDDYAAKMNAFADDIVSTAQFARENSRDAAAARIIDALRCKECHDLYRKKD